MEENPCCFERKWNAPVTIADTVQNWRMEISSAQKKVSVSPITSVGAFATIPANAFPVRARLWTFPNMTMRIFLYKKYAAKFFAAYFLLNHCKELVLT